MQGTVSRGWSRDRVVSGRTCHGTIALVAFLVVMVTSLNKLHCCFTDNRKQ